MANTFLKSLLIALFCGLLCLSCNSSAVKDAKSSLDLVDGVPRKDLNFSILGTNAFVNDSRFGSIGAQFTEVRDTLRLRHVRVLMAWNSRAHTE